MCITILYHPEPMTGLKDEHHKHFINEKWGRGEEKSITVHKRNTTQTLNI